MRVVEGEVEGVRIEGVEDAHCVAADRKEDAGTEREAVGVNGKTGGF